MVFGALKPRRKMVTSTIKHAYTHRGKHLLCDQLPPPFSRNAILTVTAPSLHHIGHYRLHNNFAHLHHPSLHTWL